MKRDHERVSPEGKSMGLVMVRLVSPAIADMALEGELDERCSSCAFRYGTVPNGCLQTQLDVLKAVSEGKRFTCHMKEPVGTVTCHGWYAARVALRRGGARMETPCLWDFSAPDEPRKP